MPVVRVDNYFDAYRIRSQAEDIHELAARPDKKAVTEFVNRRILELMQLQPDDFLVDIGCGDASLLRMLGPCSRQTLGIVATDDEEQRLRTAFPGISLKAGDVRSLPLEAGIASKIVCNAVLLYLETEKEVKAGLCEIRRIARPRATILVGEIPAADEYAHYGIYRGTSMAGLLWHIARRNGTRAFLGMIRRWIKAVFGNEQIVLNSAGLFYANPERMIEMAESCGLVLKSHFRHREVDEHGNVADSPFRYDYLFTV